MNTTVRTALIDHHRYAFSLSHGNSAAREYHLMVRALHSTTPFTNPEILALAYAVNTYVDAMKGIRPRSTNSRLILATHDRLAAA